MTSYPDERERKSLRLQDYDYSQSGMYFITLVTWQRECLFGQVTNDVMILNGAGSLAQSEWNRITNRFSGIELDYFVMMPNHLHGILSFTQSGVGKIRTLGDVIGAYKSNVARLINGIRRTPGAPIWQRNFYEHIIRNEDDLARVRQYIQNNPCYWTLDHENPDRKE